MSGIALEAAREKPLNKRAGTVDQLGRGTIITQVNRIRQNSRISILNLGQQGNLTSA